MTTTTGSAVSADGTRIVFHSQGSGPPLLVVHGTLATADMYRPIANVLSAKYRVVLMERRNYGISGAGPAALARQAEDVAAVLDALAAPAFVFAHSFGGLVALQASVTAGPAIDRLALYEPPVSFAGPAMAPVLARCRELVDAGRPTDAVAHFLVETGDPSPALHAWLRPITVVLARRAGGMLADLECVTGMDPDPGRWAALATPTLLLTGAETNRYGRENTAMLRKVLPDARTVILPGLAHQPEDPVPVADALHGFFGLGRGQRPAAPV